MRISNVREEGKGAATAEQEWNNLTGFKRLLPGKWLELVLTSVSVPVSLGIGPNPDEYAL